MAISRFPASRRPFLLLFLVCLILLLLSAIGLDVPLLIAIMAGETRVVPLLPACRFDWGCPSCIEGCGPTSLAAFFINDPSDDLHMLECARHAGSKNRESQNLIGGWQGM